MTGLGDALALAVAGFAVLAGMLALLRTGRVRSALPVTLDLLTAAGLLRLSVQQDWRSLAGAATIIAIRHLVVWAFAPRPEPPALSRPSVVQRRGFPAAGTDRPTGRRRD